MGIHLDGGKWLGADVKDPTLRRPLCPQHRTFGPALRVERNKFQTDPLPPARLDLTFVPG